MVSVSWESILKVKPRVDKKIIQKQPSYITLEDYIKRNLEKYGEESVFAKANPLRFNLDKGKLMLMRGDKEKSISNQKFKDVMNEKIIPEKYKDVKDMRPVYKEDNEFQKTIENLGKEKLGFLYYIFTGKTPPPKQTAIEEKQSLENKEYLDLMQDVFGHTKYAQFDYDNTFNKKMKLLDDTYKLFLDAVPKNEWNQKQQTIARNILQNKIKGLLMVVKDTEKHIINNPSYELKKSQNRLVKSFRQFYNLVKYFLVKKNTTIEQILEDLTLAIEGEEGQIRISDSLRNKWEKEENRLKLFLSNLDLTRRQENKLITIINEVEEAIFKNNDEEDEYELTKEEVARIIKDNVDNLKGENLSSDFFEGLREQFLRLINPLGKVKGIENLMRLLEFEKELDQVGELEQRASPDRAFAYRDDPETSLVDETGKYIKKALNPKLASLPEEPIKRLKKTLQAAEPSEYFGQDYTRLGELIDLLQEMDFTKGDSELDEKIKSISEQNIDMVATAARLRKTYETLYLQVRKIVYPNASEGSLREEEEA